MKSIELKEVDLDGNTLSYKKELGQIIKTPSDPNSGASIEEMRGAIRVLDALDNSEDTLELEDADYKWLVTRMASARFGIVHPAIVQFVDDVTSAE